MFHPQGPTLLELIDQALGDMTRGYDLLAPRFDHTPFRTPDAILNAVGARIDSLGPPPRQAIDLCCGTGAVMQMLRPRCEEAVVGIDLSQGMLDVARARLATAPGGAALRFVRADALALACEEAFDLATCFGAMGHISPRQQRPFFARVHRALRPGGRLLFAAATRPSITSAEFWIHRSFNAVMRLRNALIKPPFIMYYGRVVLPDVLDLLRSLGFDARAEPLQTPRPLRTQLVIATRPPQPPA